MNKIKFSLIGGFAAASVMFATTVFAAPGQQLAPGPINPANGCGEFNGVGVAYDGTNILFTCTNEAAVRMTDTSGTDMGFQATADAAGNPVALDAIAWDSNEGVLWGGNTSSDNVCHIFSVDMTSGVATERFSFSDPSLSRCNELFFDGITLDPTDDTVWVSPDIHTTIRHFQKDGTEIVADAIDFTGLTLGECPWAQGFGNTGCWNSGLAMGLDGNLFAGTASDGKIYQLDPSVPASSGVFASVSGRDEDLECGPLVEGFESILSRDFDTGQIDILEAPDGTCVITQITLDPPTEVNDFTLDQDHAVTATVTANGQPLSGVLVSFSVKSGPNVGQASEPTECTVDPNCNTDASGQTTWSYVSSGLGTDVIVACYTTAGGTTHCAEAEKVWSDLTPPELSCTESTNPHGQNTPPAGSTTLPGSKGGQNEDGFYLLTAEDLLDPNVQIFVSDTSGSGPFGAYSSGDTVKLTESTDDPAEAKPMGNNQGQAGAVAAHIILNSDAVVQAVDASGNTTKVSCLVPPPPK